jgi:hypothetical protein
MNEERKIDAIDLLVASLAWYDNNTDEHKRKLVIDAVTHVANLGRWPIYTD